MTATAVRQPAQAGRFYPGSAKELRKTVEELIAKAKAPGEAARPIGLVSPHAGYIFSGATAAHAYQTLAGKGIERVVVLAPSHYAHCPGASIFDGRAYRMPMGEIPLDQDLIALLRADRPDLFIFEPEADEEEHSLEVQLPFLQAVLGEGWKLTPVIISKQSWGNCREIGEALGRAIAKSGAAEKTVVVASSDLYHGSSYKECKKSDQKIAEAVERFEPERLVAGNERGEFMACGAGPIAATMVASRALGATRARVLAQTNSYDAHPVNDSYIVGYLAAVFVE
ncbi:MAG: AmmeMemoRadiSam system protein B, partial [bacterium]